jgi:tRNA (guanine10-N2)-dimethyltransferase
VYCLELAGEDDAFAAREAASAATDVEVVAPGVATARGVRDERVADLAYTRRVSLLVGRTDASVESARALLSAAGIDPGALPVVSGSGGGTPTADQTSEAGRTTDAVAFEDSATGGERATGELAGTVAVRARDVRATSGVSTREAERALGSALVERGFEVNLDDPDHVLRALFSDGVCVLGWLAVEGVRDYGARRPTDRPFFQPGSMDPKDARALVNLAGAEPGARLLDPMCGTGGVLIEAGLVGARAVGVDAQAKMVRGARENLAAYVPGAADVARGDATALPFRDDSFDGAVFDAPYGRQSKVARHDLSDLVGGALAEARRVAPRAVVVGDRSWETAAREAGWNVEARFERRVHRSLVRHVHLLSRE